MAFIEELKRRNVFKVGVAYIVVSWVMLQLVDVVREPFNLPLWVPRLVIVLLAVGLPIALVISWAFELTPEGLVRDASVDKEAARAKHAGRGLNKLIAVALAVALGFIAYQNFFRAVAPEPAAPKARDASIAVLPFTDLSPKGDQEYFSDGISEELLNVLAKIPKLRVAARTSSFQFKGEHRDIKDIGKQLNVAYVLEGSVRKEADEVRITAQLIDAVSGFHVWSETYDRPLKNVFAIQDEISASIGDKLASTMGLAGAMPTNTTIETSPEAYEAYLRGRYLMEKRNVSDMVEATSLFEKALKIDPNYSPAMARLAITYLLLPSYDFRNYSQVQMESRALPLVQKALELTPNLAEAQAAMGRYQEGKGQYAEAEKRYLKAIELNPSYANVYSWLASLYKASFRFEDSFTWRKRAIEVDPLSVLATGNLFFAYLERNEQKQAEALLPRIKDLSESRYHQSLAWLDRTRQDESDAAIEALRVLSMDPALTQFKINLDDLLTSYFGLPEESLRIKDYFAFDGSFALGRKDAIREKVVSILAQDPNRRPMAASVYLALGDLKLGRDMLETYYEEMPAGEVRLARMGVQNLLLLAVLRHANGDEAGVQELVAPLQDIADKQRKSEVRFLFERYQLAILELLKGDENGAREALQEAVSMGFMPFWESKAILNQFPGFDWQSIIAANQERLKGERDTFLAVVCNGGNPAPDVWSPLPETCTNYVKPEH